MNPEGEPSGTVTRRPSVYTKPQPQPVVIEIKSTVLPVTGETSWSWWATVDRHPWSDKLGYSSEPEAIQAAGQWVAANYPTREFTIEGV